MLKKLLVVTAIVLFTFVSCESQSANNNNLKWETDLGVAIKKAKDENKTVLVNFTGSDWCIWCQRLSNEVFSKNEFEKFADDNLILVKVDFPRNIEQSTDTKMYNNQLAQRFGIEGFPTVLLFNSQGRLVLRTGYQEGGPEAYVNSLKSYL